MAGRVANEPRWRLTDLIDVETLQSIQDSFARTFGLPTVIVFPDGTNATRITQRLAFCEDLTRASPAAGPRCAGCDLAAMSDAAAAGRPAIFECWNGLYDAAVPIVARGETLGYFLCGQVLTAPPDAQHYAATAAEIGIDPADYVAALAGVRVLDAGQYTASVHSMHVLAELIAEQAAARLENLETLAEARRAQADAARLLDELDAVMEGLRAIAAQPGYRSTLEAVADNLDRLIGFDSCIVYLVDETRGDLEPVVVRDPYPEQMRAHRPRLGEGVIGRAAVAGAPRRFADLTLDPDFSPAAGVPVEPEAALVVPMEWNGTVAGVIVLSRFERRTFTEHELRLLRTFASQANVSIQLARVAAASAGREREERALEQLLRVAAGPARLDGVLAEIARVGIELLDADAAAAQAGTGEPVLAGLSRDEAEPLLARVSGEVAAERLPDGRYAVLVPLAAGEERVGAAAFVRASDSAWDLRAAAALAAQASLVAARALLVEREQELVLRRRRLAAITGELATAADADEARERLLARMSDVVSGADACLVVLVPDGHDPVRVELRHGRERASLTLALPTSARLAGTSLRSVDAGARELFDAWCDAALAELGRHLALGPAAAEPLVAPGRVVGALVAAARPGGAPLGAGDCDALAELAAAASAALARFSDAPAGEGALARRVDELEAVARLARRLALLTAEPEVVAALVASLVELTGLDRAACVVRGVTGLVPVDAAALSAGDLAAIESALDRGASTLDDGRRLITVPLALDAGAETLLVGLGASDARAPERILAGLARHGASALASARLHARERDAARVLALHERIATAAVAGRGLDTLAAELADFLGGELAVVAAHGRVLAGAASISWSPPEETRTTVVEDAEGAVVAAPALVDGEALAWVVARVPSRVSDAERAAVEYGALLAALDLLRERTAVEVATRLRGGLLDELFRGEVVPDLAAERALALGYDLSAPSRVFLLEPAEHGRDADALFAAAAGAARAWHEANLVALQGGAVIAVVPEDRRPGGGRFEDALRAAAHAAAPATAFRIGVGTACACPADYRRSYLAARRALDLLRVSGRSDELFSFRDASVEGMLLQSTEPEVLLDFVARYVEPLDAYDRTHSSQLRLTVRAYLEAGGNLEAAARALHVHVSTLRYRLARAGELLGADVRSAETRLDLQVALRAADVLAARPS